MLKILSTLCIFILSITSIDCCYSAPLPHTIFVMPPLYKPRPPPNPVNPPRPPKPPSTPSPRNDELKEGPKMPDYCIQINHNMCQNCFK